MEISQKTRNRTTIASYNSAPGHLSKENKNTDLKEINVLQSLLQHYYL